MIAGGIRKNYRDKSPANILPALKSAIETLEQSMKYI